MKEKIKVLLVEDELTLAMIIKDTLEENDFTLTIAANGEEGLRMFFDIRPDEDIVYGGGWLEYRRAKTV